jgi:hypothetical protein
MIIVQDRIEVAAQNLEQLQTMFSTLYQPLAAERGLNFVEALVSPPLKLDRAPCTLWLRWQVANAGAWWSMRLQASHPSVADFWQDVDAMCISRERIYLTGDPAGQLQMAEDTQPYAVDVNGYRETVQLRLKDGVAESDKVAFTSVLTAASTRLPGVKFAHLGANMAPEYAVGHFTWDLLFPDEVTASAAHSSDFWQQQVVPALERYCEAYQALAMDVLGAGMRQLGLRNGVKRTAYFRLLPAATPQQAEQFEQDLLEMPAQITDIRNWCLSRAKVLPWSTVDTPEWTYVWEQEFESLDGLTGPYMAHPHHWAHIDRWFDPESGVQAVDTYLSHAFCPLAESIMAREIKSSM